MLRELLKFGGIPLLLFLLVAFSAIERGTYTSFSPEPPPREGGADRSVEEVLVQLKDSLPLHYLPKAHPDSAQMGRELVHYGKLNSGVNKRLSKYFLCTDCHNVQPETDDPADESPDRVLQHSMKNGLPFLPGSTFYGIYNKRHWYNGDYSKKYGDLAASARDTLANAIQLCATQCAQGREMEAWEIRCVLHYFKTLELKVSDLVFSSREWSAFSAAVTSDRQRAIGMIKAKYRQANAARFGTAVTPVVEGYVPQLKNGAFIYDKGCLHCHASERNITNFHLDHSRLTFRFLMSKRDTYSNYDVVQITRYGTYSMSGRRQYMPQYTHEKMSDKQLLDLIHYIETKARE